MKNSLSRIFYFLLVLALIISGTFIVYYYWTVSDASQLRDLPMSVLVYIIIYILGQLLKRYVKKNIKWYDWVYYLGLIAIVLPIISETFLKDNILAITKYGALFLLIPPLIELALIAIKGNK
ncbi:MAG: hypothetical protein R3277_01545 [Brumimicrobium sp.]|nr:hypothetical protein [Brumimicrobium sp.]